MKKAADLRKFLGESVQGLNKDHDRLTVYIPKGSISCRYGSLSFQWRYDVELTFIDFGAHADTLIIPLLSWISVNQPDLLLEPDKLSNVLAFEAEVIDHERADVRITLPLTERVIVTQQPNGRYLATHCDEPSLVEDSAAPGWTLDAPGVDTAP